MSFLYQALLKNSQQKKSQQNTKPTNTYVSDAEAHTKQSNLTKDESPVIQAGQLSSNDLLTQPMSVASPPIYTAGNHFAQGEFASHHLESSSSRTTPWLLWLSIALLMLIVGLLAGYIAGNVNLSGAQQLQSIAAINTNIPQVEATKNTAQANKVSAKDDLRLAATATHQQNSALSVSQQQANKLVEVKVDQQGKVNANVSNLDAINRAAPEPNAPNTSNAPNANTEQSTEQSAEQNTELEQIHSAKTTSSLEPTQNEEAEAIDLSQVPEKLKASFAKAVEASQNQTLENSNPQDNTNFTVSLTPNNHLPLLSELSAEQRKGIPNMEYQMHIFASDINQRWVRINGKTLYEGQALTSNLTLLEIKQDKIIWRFNDKKIGQLALVDFKL